MGFQSQWTKIIRAQQNDSKVPGTLGYFFTAQCRVFKKLFME
jgi:hypothetical protein